MGRVVFASELFNCSAPDTGNMEVRCRSTSAWFRRYTGAGGLYRGMRMHAMLSMACICMPELQGCSAPRLQVMAGICLLLGEAHAALPAGQHWPRQVSLCCMHMALTRELE